MSLREALPLRVPQLCGVSRRSHQAKVAPHAEVIQQSESASE
jgi:hypothetical protein